MTPDGLTNRRDDLISTCKLLGHDNKNPNIDPAEQCRTLPKINMNRIRMKRKSADHSNTQDGQVKCARTTKK